MKKNKTMLIISLCGLVLTALVHILHRSSLFMKGHGHHGEILEVLTQNGMPNYYYSVSGWSFSIPVGLFMIAVYLYLKSPYHEQIPLMITLTLTMMSVNMIMGGEGMIEYHFFIFIVIALIAFYDQIYLILIAGFIFTLQHIVGYFVPAITYFVFGVTGYSLVMTMMHVIAVVLMSIAIITQIKTRKTLVTESETDHLTNVYNRRAILRKIYDHNRENPELTSSLIFLDLDYFKKVNDTYGHEAGDKLLIQLAELLRSKLKVHGEVARYGGEEFVLFLPEFNKEEAYQLAEEIRTMIEEHPFKVTNQLSHKQEKLVINMTASIGVASYPEQCKEMEDLIRFADRAMYVGSKLEGRNRVSLFDSTMS